jgi:hypothetical protein
MAERENFCHGVRTKGNCRDRVKGGWHPSIDEQTHPQNRRVRHPRKHPFTLDVLPNCLSIVT